MYRESEKNQHFKMKVRALKCARAAIYRLWDAISV